MLVLSRKTREEIVLPQFGIVLTVLDIRRDQIRLGITAPSDIQVHRREVWERLQQAEEARHLVAAPEAIIRDCAEL